MKIYIKNHSNKVFELDIECSDTIYMVKHKIYNKIGIPPNLIRLIYKGRHLHDEMIITVANYNIRSKETIDYIHCYRGD
jgi:ubiquitin